MKTVALCVGMSGDDFIEVAQNLGCRTTFPTPENLVVYSPDTEERPLSVIIKRSRRMPMPNSAVTWLKRLAKAKAHTESGESEMSRAMDAARKRAAVREQEKAARQAEKEHEMNGSTPRTAGSILSAAARTAGVEFKDANKVPPPIQVPTTQERIDRAGSNVIDIPLIRDSTAIMKELKEAKSDVAHAKQNVAKAAKDKADAEALRREAEDAEKRWVAEHSRAAQKAQTLLKEFSDRLEVEAAEDAKE